MDGKDVLLKSVACGMLNFAMQYFVLPKRLCDDLENALQNFWWGTTVNNKKIH